MTYYPGLWEVKGDDVWKTNNALKTKSRIFVADHEDLTINAIERDCHLRLAAAAPELLELAKDYLASLLSSAKYLEFNDDQANELPTIKKVRAIIAKAEGKG